MKELTEMTQKELMKYRGTKDNIPRACLIAGPAMMRLYSIWRDMIKRALHKPYLLKGILRSGYEDSWAHCDICEEWLTFEGFKASQVAKDLVANPTLTIDRIDNNRGYWPDNCRAATISEQNRNRRMTPRRYAANLRNLEKANEAKRALKRKRAANEE